MTRDPRGDEGPETSSFFPWSLVSDRSGPKFRGRRAGGRANSPPLRPAAKLPLLSLFHDLSDLSRVSTSQRDMHIVGRQRADRRVVEL